MHFLSPFWSCDMGGSILTKFFKIYGESSFKQTRCLFVPEVLAGNIHVILALKVDISICISCSEVIVSLFNFQKQAKQVDGKLKAKNICMLC